MSEKLDVIIFGASGFSGKIVVSEIHRISKSHCSIAWAIAGRSEQKLKEVIEDLQRKTNDDLSNVQILIADIFDNKSMIAMTARAKVLINCCGPFVYYGEDVAKACISTKTHYVDISAEDLHVETIQLKYNKLAEDAGVYIITACGLVSVPIEMGVQFLEKNFKGQLNSIETCYTMYFTTQHKFYDTVSCNTSMETFINTLLWKKELDLVRKDLYNDEIPELSPGLDKKIIFHKNDAINKWILPEYTCNESSICRTQKYFYEREQKRPIRIKSHIGFESFGEYIQAFMVALILRLIVSFKGGKELLMKWVEVFSFGAISSKGPSENILKNSATLINIHGVGLDENENDKIMGAQIHCKNPYVATATAVVCAAITVLTELEKLPGRGGVLPPGAAFSKTSLLKLLNANDMEFNIKY